MRFPARPRGVFPLVLLALGGLAGPATGCTVDDEPVPGCADLGGALEGGKCVKTSPIGTGGGAGTSSQPNSLAGTCYAPSGCEVLAENKCLAKTDNSGSARKTLRMSQLRVRQPAKLANKFVQFTIVSPAVTQYDEPCLLKDANKGGLFNWLIDFDTAAKKMRTGGARAVGDVADGYCFLKSEFLGLTVEPIDTDMNFDEATGAFSTTSPLARLTVPIFQTRGANDVPILLPLLNAEIFDGTLSPDGNCIGRYRGESGELSAGDCDTSNSQDEDGDFLFTDAASIKGSISLEEADQVKIIDFSGSLCVLLTGVGVKDASNYSTCERDAGGNLTPKVMKFADSASQPGGALDAVQLVASFSASAVKINDGECD